ncbi:hypothetical protein D3C85_580180 [compost metagenome]
MTGKKPVADDHDWPSDAPLQSADSRSRDQRYREACFCTHRLFVLAYVMITIVVFGYLSQKTAHMPDEFVAAYWAGGFVIYASLLCLVALFHVYSIFDLKVSHYTKD